MLTKEDAKFTRWQEHFGNVLNVKSAIAAEVFDEIRGEERLDVDISLAEPPDFGLVEAAIKQLKNGTAPEYDQITPDLLKAGVEPVVA